MTDHVLVTVEDGVQIVTINRPDKKNALTAEMYKVLADAIEVADADPKIRVTYYTGTGGSFTAGNDLADFAKAGTTPVDEQPTEKPHVTRFLENLANAEKPIVAAVNGLAVGVEHLGDVAHVVPEAGRGSALEVRVPVGHRPLLEVPDDAREGQGFGHGAFTCPGRARHDGQREGAQHMAGLHDVSTVRIHGGDPHIKRQCHNTPFRSPARSTGEGARAARTGPVARVVPSGAPVPGLGASEGAPGARRGRPRARKEKRPAPGSGPGAHSVRVLVVWFSDQS